MQSKDDIIKDLKDQITLLNRVISKLNNASIILERERDIAINDNSMNLFKMKLKQKFWDTYKWNANDH